MREERPDDGADASPVEPEDEESRSSRRPESSGRRLPPKDRDPDTLGFDHRPESHDGAEPLDDFEPDDAEPADTPFAPAPGSHPRGGAGLEDGAGSEDGAGLEDIGLVDSGSAGCGPADGEFVDRGRGVVGRGARGRRKPGRSDADAGHAGPREASDFDTGVDVPVEAAGDADRGDDSEDADSEDAHAEAVSSAPKFDMPFGELKRAVEAVLFATSDPLPIRALAEVFGAPLHDVRQAVEELKDEYVAMARAFRLEEVAGGLQLLSQPAYDTWIRKLKTAQGKLRLSPAAFETLAVIAYKQPITKADLEAIRGVQCGPILKTLLDRGLVRVAGRDESLGKPLLYGTTTKFLESFGISNLRDLPQPELKALRDPSTNEGDADFDR
jgi:segregation and condensation protein B